MNDLTGFYIVGALTLLAIAIFAYIANENEKKESNLTDVSYRSNI